MRAMGAGSTARRQRGIEMRSNVAALGAPACRTYLGACIGGFDSVSAGMDATTPTPRDAVALRRREAAES